MTDPYKEWFDQGDKSNYQIFSNGPYKLEGAPGTRQGRDVRPQRQLRRFDGRPGQAPRGATGPDRLQSQTTEPIYDRLIADTGDDQTAVTGCSIPPSYYSQIEGPVADRAAAGRSPYADYVVPNRRG